MYRGGDERTGVTWQLYRTTVDDDLSVSLEPIVASPDVFEDGQSAKQDALEKLVILARFRSADVIAR